MEKESITLILYCLLIGFSLAMIICLTIKTVYGKFIGTLISKGATNTKNGMGLDELGFDGNILIKRRKNFFGIVSVENGKYYIPEEKLEKAKKLFKRETVSIKEAAILVLLIALLYIAIKFGIPYILK